MREVDAGRARRQVVGALHTAHLQWWWELGRRSSAAVRSSSRQQQPLKRAACTPPPPPPREPHPHTHHSMYLPATGATSFLMRCAQPRIFPPTHTLCVPTAHLRQARVLVLDAVRLVDDDVAPQKLAPVVLLLRAAPGQAIRAQSPTTNARPVLHSRQPPTACLAELHTAPHPSDTTQRYTPAVGLL